MATYTKKILNGSINGKQILVDQTISASATSIHTAIAGTSALDEVYLYAYNDTTSSIQLNVLWGGTVEPNDVMRVAVPYKSGRTLIVDGKLLQNSLTIKAYASVANVICIDGFVNNIA